MGAMMSKLFAPAIIDLTRADEQSQNQPPLPQFEELLRNNRLLSGSTSPQRSPRSQTPPRPPNTLHTAFQGSAEIINLVSPPSMPEPPANGLSSLLRDSVEEGDPCVGSSAANPILVLDGPVNAPVPPPLLRQPVVQTLSQDSIPETPKFPPWATLVLFSDGSLVENSWGGAGVAFWSNGYWTGKAFALGFTRGGSREAEARAIVEAFKLSFDLLRPGHKMVEVCSDALFLVRKFQNMTPGRANERWLAEVSKMGAQLAEQGVVVKLTWVKGHDDQAGIIQL